MTQPAAWAAIGTLLKMGDGGGPEVFTTIARVRDINGPEFSTDIVDVTSQDSPDFTEETMATLKRLGEVTFTISYLPTDPTHDGTTGIVSKWKGRTKTNFQLIQTDDMNNEWDFAGFVVKMGPKFPVAGVITQDIGIRLSGAEGLTLA